MLGKIKYFYKKSGFYDSYLESPFFDSLREDYPEFNLWYTKSIDDVKKSSHYWMRQNELIAFVAFKVEENEELQALNYKNNSLTKLKICTIKSITNTLENFSEFCIYLAFREAISKNINEVYFTIIDNSIEKKKLISIAENYGFIKYKKSNKDNEYFLIKNLLFDSGFPYTWKNLYPRIKTNNFTCTILPIEAKYHDNYIQDAELRNGNLSEHDPTKFTIRKSYAHSMKKISELAPGDVILIYRKKGYDSPSSPSFTSAVTSFAIIDKHFIKGIDFNTEDEYSSLMKNYHGFENKEDLSNFYEKKYVTIFCLVYSFGKGKNINYNWLISNVWNRNERPEIQRISLENFKKILNIGGANAKYYITD